MRVERRLPGVPRMRPLHAVQQQRVHELLRAAPHAARARAGAGARADALAHIQAHHLHDAIAGAIVARGKAARVTHRVLCGALKGADSLDQHRIRLLELAKPQRAVLVRIELCKQLEPQRIDRRIVGCRPAGRELTDNTPAKAVRIERRTASLGASLAFIASFICWVTSSAIDIGPPPSCQG